MSGRILTEMARAWLYSAMAFALLSVYSAAAVQADLARQGQTVPWWPIVRSLLPSALLWTAGSPFLVALARRRPLMGARWLPAAALHALVWSSWIVVASAGARAIESAWRGWPAEGLARYVVSQPTALLMDALIGAGLVMLGTALALRDRAERVERARQRLADENARLHGQLAQAQLHALRARLHPHFLFNALGAVSTLVRKGDTTGAISMIAGLGDLLRVALSADREPLIPLGRELDLARRYLQVQSARYGSALTWSIDATAEAERALVPCLALQPILENAVEHGIEACDRGGRIDVSAGFAADTLLIVVANDGPPLPRDFTLERDAGVGLRISLERLRSTHPDARLTLGTRPGGVVVTLQLPRSEVASCAS
jgi:signal transduction histidine kinase